MISIHILNIKGVVMEWFGWLDGKSQGLPEKVGLALEKQFQLDSGATGNWCFLAQSGKFAGRPVRSFRIIDPSLIRQETKSPKRYRDLDGGSYQKALQFEGHIEREGYVVLQDRRSKPPAASQENFSAA
jgi:hypothetical protein